MAERLVKFDNAKLILIVLVVAGHFIETFIFGFAPGSAFASGTFTFIYSFHMPLFIFISGLFLRDMDEQTSFPARRVAMLITLGFAMKVVRAIFGYVVTGHTSFDLLSDSATPWFMFTLAACYALAWLLRLQNRAAVLVMALLIGMFVGYDQTIGDFLYLSRTVVFFPFFGQATVCDQQGCKYSLRNRRFA
ncbi:MAG: acyltransferase family protein [Varibaculum sp.]|nr:acyltransferase family protein [Varibaculum sp.]